MARGPAQGRDHMCDLLVLGLIIIIVLYCIVFSKHIVGPMVGAALFRPPGPASAGRGGLYILLLYFFCPHL